MARLGAPLALIAFVWITWFCHIGFIDNLDTGLLAARFMNTLIEMAVRMTAMAAEASGIHRVVLSGGSFQNQYLMHRLPPRLRRLGLEVYHHRRVSCNDEGLALGQLRIASARL